jgi:ureidoglycolate lyase
MTAQPARISSEVRTIEIRSQELTPEAFAPYGVVSTAGRSAKLDFGGPANVAQVCVEPRPFYLDFLARHIHTAQMYVPLDGRESVLVVAPPSDLADPKALPDLTRVAAFRLDGSRAVTLHRGTWHRTPFVDAAAAHFIVIDRLDTLEDLDLVDLKLNLSAEISIRP